MIAQAGRNVAAIDAASRRSRTATRARKRREALTAYLLIAPAFLLFLGFIAGPLAAAPRIGDSRDSTPGRPLAPEIDIFPYPPIIWII